MTEEPPKQTMWEMFQAQLVEAREHVKQLEADIRRHSPPGVPMTTSTYKKMTEREMVKKRWRLRRDVATGGMVIPAGTEVRIHGKHNGCSITGPPCSCCGVSVRVHKLDCTALEEVIG